jgi:hypothetical protein
VRVLNDSLKRLCLLNKVFLAAGSAFTSFMIHWLRSWLARLAVVRTRRRLEKRLQRSGKVAKIIAPGSKLVLTSYDFEAERTGTVITRNADTGEVVERVASLKTSTWGGSEYFPLWGDKLTVSVSTQGTRPSPQQIGALEAIISHPHSIKDAVEGKVFQFYNAVVQPHAPRDESGAPLPQISSSSEICKVVSLPPTIELGEVSDGVIRFVLMFNAKWNYYSLNCAVEDWRIATVN